MSRVAWNIFDLARILAALGLVAGLVLGWPDGVVLGLLGFILAGLVLSMVERLSRRNWADE